MNKKSWTVAAVVLAVSGVAFAGEMSSGSGGGSNPASEKGVTTPRQPNETQPGMSAGTGDMKGNAKGMKGKGAASGEMKSDTGSGGSGMKGSSSSGMGGGMSSGNSNMGNPAESKGSKTPSQPNETQPGMGGNKK